MPFYVYESMPASPKEPVSRFELWQSMKDAPYTHHPETGIRIHRIIVGGVGMPGSITDPKADRPDGPSVKPDR